MTKKSQSRLDRDAAKKNMDEFRKTSNTWNDLEDIYVQCRSMATGITNQISQMFSVDKIGNFLPDAKMSSDLIRCLSSDIQQVTNELDEIHSKHADRKGGCVNDDEFISSLTFIEAYNAFQVKFDGVIMPNVKILTEQFDQAIAKVDSIVNKSESSDVLDPTIITDVVVKEETK